MKKLFLLSAVFALVLAYSCKNKLNNKNAVTPTYKENSTGTGANPNLGNVTVTGSVKIENMATENSAVQIGTGWTFDACTSGGNVLTAHLSGTSGEVTLTFAAAPTTGTYTLTNGVPIAGQCRMVIKDAPGQPRDIYWYSKTGTVNVNVGTTTSATFCNIDCYQEKYLFPKVTACGYLICM